MRVGDAEPKPWVEKLGKQVSGERQQKWPRTNSTYVDKNSHSSAFTCTTLPTQTVAPKHPAACDVSGLYSQYVVLELKFIKNLHELWYL